MKDGKDFILEIKNLNTEIGTGENCVKIINGVNFNVEKGKILGLVGESGSGKSVTMLSVMGLLGRNARVTGQVNLCGENLLAYDEEQMRSVRGGKISMIFQDPMTALNPVYTIGNQIKEMIYLHRTDVQDATQYAAELLEAVGISDGKSRLKQYPHELSGGMRQRVVIAMALASNPDILIADEPTTALDVTVQAQVLKLMKDLHQANSGVLLITHDLGVVSQMATKLAVMKSGRVIETSDDPAAFFANPTHPYSQALVGEAKKMELE